MSNEFSDDEKALIRKVRWYHHLLDGGWFQGRLGNREASIRRDEISKLRAKLGITTKQQTQLLNSATLEGFECKRQAR